MEEEKIYSLIQLGYKIKEPRVKLGTEFHAYYQTPKGLKMVEGYVINNNMIHFATLEPMYTIMTDDVDEIGRKVILDGVPESLFL